MKQITVTIFSLFISYFAYGQNQSVSVLQKTIDKINSLKTLSYDYRSTYTNPFSAGDTVQASTKSVLEFDGRGLLKRTREKTEINKGESRFEIFFKNDTLYQVDLLDSTYTLYPKPVQADISSTGLMPVIELIRNAVKENPTKIFQKKDTVVNGIDCHNFLIKTYDSVVNGQHNFTNEYIAINKITNLPVLYKSNVAGIIEKDGHFIGRVNSFNEDYFSNFKIDKAIDPSVFNFDLSSFSLPNKNMLAEGSIAPTLRLKNLQSKEVPPAEFKNKLLLIEFGATDCGANPLANPILNRLYKKYALLNFSIVSIYSGESAGKVKKYIDANSLEFPVYLGSLQNKKIFKTVHTPNFYLVDKNGKVLKSIDGYNDDLEKELSEKIDEALRN